MPLNPQRLKEDLETFFAAPGATEAACGAQWGACMQFYATSIVPPSLTVAAAATALASALTAVFLSKSPSTIANVEAAFVAFAVAVGGGMAPTFVGAPPPGLVGFAAEIARPPSEWAQNHPDAAELWGNKIHAWMSTGTATLAVPPATVQTWT